MEFTDDVKALVVIGSKKRLCSDSMQVYNFLSNNGVEHELAADAQGWTELAYADETYSEIDFDIYMQ